MTKFRSISHVIFDMDGVLLDTEPLYTKATQNVVGKYGKNFTWELKVKMMGAHREDAAKFLCNELQLPITWHDYDLLVQEEYKVVMAHTDIIPDTEGIYKNAIASIVKRFGKIYTTDIVTKVTGTVEKDSARIVVNEMKLPITIEEFQHEFRTKSRNHFTNYHVELMAGAKKLVQHLHKNNIPMSVATSSSQDSFDLKTRKHKDFFNLFDHIICGGTDPEVKHGKPSPDIFLISASRFPDKPKPECCLVMEDAPNGVQAAISAGMQVVMIPDKNVPEELREKATVVVQSLDTVPLEKFNLPALT